MKYKLLKKIEGIDWEVGKVLTSDENKGNYSLGPILLHNLLQNGTIEKVEENINRVLSVVMYEGDTDTNTYLFQKSMTEAQAQAVANQIKELLIKSHQ